MVVRNADKNKYFRQRTNCPLCARSEPKNWIALFPVQQIFWEVHVVECPFCGFCFKDWIPNKQLMSIIYSSSYTHFTPCSRSAASIQALKSRVQRLGPPLGRHLDYCCGSGSFVEAAIGAGWESHGADPFLSIYDMQETNRSHLFRVDVAIPDQRAILDRYDCISVWAGMEHISNAGEAMRGLLTLLKPGGKLIFNSPNAKSLIAKTNGSKWAMAQLVEHVSFWTPKAVRFFAHKEMLSVKAIRFSGTPFPLGGCPVEISAQGVGGLQEIVGEIGPSAIGTLKNSKGMNRENKAIQKVLEYLLKNGGRNTLTNMTRRLIDWFRLGDHIEVIMIINNCQDNIAHQL